MTAETSGQVLVFFFTFLLSHGGSCNRLLILYGGGALRKRAPEKKYPYPFLFRKAKQGRQKSGVGFRSRGTILASGDTAHRNNKAEKETAAHYINNYNTGVHPAETFSEKTGGIPLSTD